MPEISRFLGISIFMNFNEHNPPHYKEELINNWNLINTTGEFIKISPLE